MKSSNNIIENQSAPLKKIIFYYHHFGGYGHGMRILSICKALRGIRNFDILVINSGKKQAELGIDRYARVLNLPPVFAKQSLFDGLATNGDMSEVMSKRQAILEKIVEKFRPDLAVIEHFPFGRMSLEGEICAFLESLKRRECKVYSSVRDLILTKGEKKHFQKFSGIFIHEDKVFDSSSDHPTNSVFTGRVHPYDTFKIEEKIKKSLNLGGKKLIVASIGGGLDGYQLLDKLVRVKSKIDKKVPCRLMIFTGESITDKQWDVLNNDLPKDCDLIRFDAKIMDYVSAADLFISMGGYNSINSHLFSSAPSMVFPRLIDQEQQDRAKAYGFQCYNYESISEEELLSEICFKLTLSYEQKRPAQMNGAETTARFITKALDLKRAKIRVKTRCNLDCAMCSWKDLEEQLEVDRICSALDDLAMLSVGVINFTGGEPTTFPGLEKVIDYAKNKGFQISLSTNGFNLSPLERIVQNLDYVDISIDSHISQLNDEIRAREGAYDRAFKSIKYLSSKGLKPHINVTVRPDNYKDLHQIIVDFSTYISSISYTLVDTSANQMEELVFTSAELKNYYSDEVINILKESVKHAIPVRIVPFYDYLEGLTNHEVLAEILRDKDRYLNHLKDIFTLKGKPCQIAKDQVRINANGAVRPCCYLDDQQVPFGNINKTSLNTIVTGDKYFKYTLQAKEGLDACSVCQQGYTGYKETCSSKV